MKKCWFSLVLLLLAPLARAESIQEETTDKSAITSFNGKAGVSVLSFQIPQELASALQESFPNSVILAHSTQCLDHKEEMGLIINQSNRLHAIIAIKTKYSWSINNLSTSVDYNHGAMQNFLSDYYDGNLEAMQVRCAVPNLDKDISVDANGEFLNGFHARNGSDYGDHICFSASDTYNSWACYRIKPGTTKPILSFVQMNAD